MEGNNGSRRENRIKQQRRTEQTQGNNKKKQKVEVIIETKDKTSVQKR